MELKFDVAIIGAGPGGCTAALALEKSGLKVALIDKSKFPRDKICGDAIASYAGKVLNTIDPKYTKALNDFPERELINSVRMYAPNKKMIDLNFELEGRISKRYDFDNFLFQLAKGLPNVTTFENSKVKEISVENNGVTIHTENDLVIHAGLIIGCDGANGIVNKKLAGHTVDLKHHAGAVRAYYKNVTGIPERTFELHFIDDILPGYFWIFPLPDNYCNVGIGMWSKAISDNKVNLKNEMQRIIDEVPYIKDRFKNAERINDIKGYGLPLGSRKMNLSGERFMLCGDAASLIDPATGEGIGQAMISGRYAGWHAAKCFSENNFSATFMKQYDKTVYDPLWKENYSRYIVQRILNYMPWLINASVSLAARNNFFKKLLKKIIW